MIKNPIIEQRVEQSAERLRELKAQVELEERNLLHLRAAQMVVAHHGLPLQDMTARELSALIYVAKVLLAEKTNTPSRVVEVQVGQQKPSKVHG